MDYTLNKFGNPYSSNDSTVLESEFRAASKKLKIVYGIWLIILIMAAVPVELIMSLITTLTHCGLIKNPKFQYYWQIYLKFFFSNLSGIDEQSHKGRLLENNLIFKIPTNLWLEYRIDGEYRDKIKSISLLRNFVNRKLFGRFHKKVQRGWKVVFEFTDPPQNGSVTITYV
jgi:hypothetical protein